MLGKMKAALGVRAQPVEASGEAENLLDALCTEGQGAFGAYESRISLGRLESWDRVRNGSEPLQIGVAVLAVRRCAARIRGAVLTGKSTDPYLVRNICTAAASHLLRRKLPFREEHMVDLAGSAAGAQWLTWGFPALSVIGVLERFCERQPPEENLRAAIRAFEARVRKEERPCGPTAATTRMRSRLTALLEPRERKDEVVLPAGRWAMDAKATIQALPPKERDAWQALLAEAATAAGKSKPAKNWLSGMAPFVDAVGRDALYRQLTEWMAQTRPDPATPDLSLEVLKGLIWSGIHLDHAKIAFPVGRFAETCFRKIPGIGARSTKLGNACLAILAEMAPSEAALSELVRLKRKVKYPSVRDLIDRRLAEAADRSGLSLADLEDMAVHDFGLGPTGEAAHAFGDVTATLAAGEDGAELRWTGADGKPRKAPPAAVRREHREALAALKQTARDLSSALTSLTASLEASWLEERSWPADVWQERYLDHPVRRATSRRLIWTMEAGGTVTAFLPGPDGLLSLESQPVSWKPDATIRLWHPLMSPADEVLAWRRRIEQAGLTQPFKQAHREVYALTDAERGTQVYSNRFAAHILRQHQFRALCQARGWRYELQGMWDSFNIPSRPIAHADLLAEYHVEMVDNDETSETGIALYLSSDQVRFRRLAGDPVELEDVPPLIFSEIMRDVDLFVAVTSVANDPTWADGGPQGRFGGYWQDVAFGELSQSARTRREVLETLIPRLAIAGRLAIADRFLEVRGNRHLYRIHLGSGNIMMMPSNRYLCIVRGGTDRKEQPVRLPFAGDSMLSVIISKALLLAEDDRITDPAILSQLGD